MWWFPSPSLAAIRLHHQDGHGANAWLANVLRVHAADCARGHLLEFGPESVTEAVHTSRDYPDHCHVVVLYDRPGQLCRLLGQRIGRAAVPVRRLPVLFRCSAAAEPIRLSMDFVLVPTIARN